MAHQVIDMKCPGCGAPTSTGETTCKYCHRPVIISTFNSVYNMPLPEVNKYAGAYRKALSENPDSMELNNSVAMCYLKLKLYDKATEAFERAMEDNFDNSETFFSSNEVHCYTYDFSITESSQKESTDVYFYKDIVSVSTQTDGSEYSVGKGKSSQFDYEYFKLTTTGGTSISCAVRNIDDAQRSINGMRALIKSKKMA